MHPISLAEVKTDFEPLQASYTLCGGEAGLFEILQASYTLCIVKTDSSCFIQTFKWSQLTVHAFYTFCCYQKGFSEHLHASYMLCV